MKVRDVMTRPVITEDENTPVDRIVKEMAELGIGSVVITRRGEPVGIITERDIALKVILKEKKASELSARDIMSTPLMTISPDSPVEEACRIFAERNIKRLPVVDEGVPVGIVSVRNVLTRMPECVKYIYPKVKILASGWTLDRIERELSGCEVCLKDNFDICMKKLGEVREELRKLASYYTEDEELIDLFKTVNSLYEALHDRSVSEQDMEMIREKFEEVLRKFRHATFWRKQQSISTVFSKGTLWFSDHAIELRKTPQISAKRIPTVFKKDEKDEKDEERK